MYIIKEILSIKKSTYTHKNENKTSLSLMAGSNQVVIYIKPQNIPLKKIKFHYLCNVGVWHI